MAITSLTTSRLTGLSSGMDTDTIIQNLMKIEQIKLNRELRQKTLLEWRQSALQGVKSDMTTFRDTFLTTSGDNAMIKSGTYTAYNVTTTDKNGAVTITADSEAFASGVTINSIQQLAGSASAKSAGKVSDPEKGQLAEGNYAALGDLNWAEGKNPFGDGEEISFKINDVSFTFSKTDTLQKMLTEINNSEANVTMSYSRLTDGFEITSKDTGAESKITIENITGNAFAADAADAAFGIGINADGVITAGAQNAIAVINGIEVERATNSFRIDGITYKLHKTTEKLDDNGDPVTKTVTDPVTGAETTVNVYEAIDVTLTKDIDGPVEKIKQFIEGYNTLLNKLNGLLDEKKNSSYYPLTEEEKSAMTESQVEQWETLAKQGLLSNEQDIRSVISNLRNAFYTTVEGTGLSAADIGLRTGTWDMKGQIVLDETALRAALEKDSSAVMNVFMGGTNSDNTSEQGLIYRMQGILNNYTKTTQSYTLDSIDNSLTRLNNKISDMEDRMADLEERYYQKYAAMETALSKLNSQSSWLTSMLNTSS